MATRTAPAPTTYVRADEVLPFQLLKVRSDDFVSEVVSRRLLADGWVRVGFTGGSTIDLLPGDLVEVRG